MAYLQVRDYSASDFANGNIELQQQTGTSVVGKSTASVKSGSASVTANQTITANPTIGALSGGKYTISVSGSKSITGSATAGWISSVSPANVSVSGSLQMDAAGAPTIGNGTINTSTWKMTVPVTANAGYNASSQSANATFDVFDGSYTVS